MSNYKKDKSELNPADARIKALEEELDEVKRKAAATEAALTALEGKDAKTKKRYITTEQWQAMSINPGNISAKIKRAGWPPEIEKAILEKVS